MFPTLDSDNDRNSSHNAVSYHFNGRWFKDSSDMMRPTALHQGNTTVGSTHLSVEDLDGELKPVKLLEMRHRICN